MKKIIIAFTIAVVATVVAICSPVRSMLGADGTEITTSEDWTPSAADYIQDGLVALWDAEWNAGIGEHLDSTFEWVDLTGNQTPLIPSISDTPLSFGKNFVIGSSNLPRHLTAGGLFSSTRTYTVEVVFTDGGMTQNNAIFSNGILYSTYGTALFANTWSANHSSVAYIVTIGSSRTSLGATATGELQSFSLSLDGSALAYKNGGLLGACKVGTSTKNRLTLGFATSDYSSKGYGYSRLYVFRIYNRALSDEEIAYNYLIDKMRFNLP